MRVLLASLRGTSGIATYAKSLAGGLAQAGHQVVLLDETFSFEPDDPRVSVAPFGPPRELPGPLEPFESWSLRGDVRRLADEYDADLVHAVRPGLTPRAVPVAITAWDPIVSPIMRFRVAGERGANRRKEAMYAIADGVAVRRAGGIAAVTTEVHRSLCRFGKPCEPIPPFLLDELVQPSRPERPHDVVMVAAAIDSYRKGLDLAIEAVARVRDILPDTRLVLIGSWVSPERRKALPEFCEVRGEVSREEVAESFASAGCCLIPSRWEEAGYAGLEALAAGIPVACSPLPAYADMSGGGVFMARRREASALADRLQEALEVERFEYPAECRATNAIPKLADLYERVSAAAEARSLGVRRSRS